MSEFSIDLDDSRLVARLGAMPDKLRRALSNKTTRLRLELEARVKQKLSGEVLNVRTGALRRSIFSDQTETANEISARVVQSADVPYGRIHEYGGTTPPHDIYPTKAKALAFVMNGRLTFAKVVHHPGSVIPERSFMRSSLAEMRDEIIAQYRLVAKEANL